MKVLSDFGFENKKVLMRCDFDVPLDEKGNILDDFRIERSIPTIVYLTKKNAKLILMCHLKGFGDEIVSVAPIQKRLAEYLDCPVIKAKNCVGKEIEDWISKMSPGDILLLENLRFYAGEKENDQEFARNLAKLGDIYINDAFATCHRKHASIVGVPKYLPSAAGLVLMEEIRILSKIRKNPVRPLIAIMGGTVQEKKGLMFVEKMSQIADFVLVGGLIKKSIEKEKFSFTSPQKIILPVKEAMSDFDLGPETLKIFKEKISQAKTIFWSGPVGKIEEERFSKGTMEIAQAIISASAFKVAGGGATIDFLRDHNLASKFNHLSTGGGSALAFLAGEKLPGIAALEEGEPRSVKLSGKP